MRHPRWDRTASAEARPEGRRLLMSDRDPTPEWRIEKAADEAQFDYDQI